MTVFLSQNGADFNDLNQNVNIINNRKKLTAVKNFDNEYVREEKYEIVFDNVKYVNTENGRHYSEMQMEIELKSAAETRINMKGLTDELEKKTKTIESISDSKYHRAVVYTNGDLSKYIMNITDKDTIDDSAINACDKQIIGLKE